MNRSATNGTASLENLIEEFASRLEAGEALDVAAFAAAHPEYAEQLGRVLPTMLLLADLGRSASASGAAPPSSVVDTEPVAGMLGDFRIIREVGRGGMGVVYEAEQISLRRRVALKVLPFAAMMDPRQLQRFQNESRAAAGLHHTNIVPVYGVGSERGVHYYAMQFIDGRTLAEFIAEQNGASPSQVATTDEAAARAAVSAPTVPPAAQVTSAAPRDAAYFRRIAEWGIQAAEALDYAHTLGVVHRDVKPANLLVDTVGRLWVTDFGLAQVQSDTRLTMTGDLVGTLRYMSPEQALANRVVIDNRTDVYSLGATLYELLTLRPVFEGRDRQELLRQIAFEEPRSLRRVNRAIPTELEIIVLKALAKEPEERYATAQELADDLRRFLEDKPIQARRPGPVARAQKWSRRHSSVVRAMGFGLVVAVVALSVSAVWAWHKQKQTEEARQYADGQRVAAEANAEEADKQHREADENFRQAVMLVTRILGEVFDPRGRQTPETRREGELIANAAITLIEKLLNRETPSDREGRFLMAKAHEGMAMARLIRGEAIESSRAFMRAHDICAQLRAEFPAEDVYNLEMQGIEKTLQQMQPEQLGQRAADAGQHQVAANAFRDCLVVGQVIRSEVNDPVFLQRRATCGVKLADELRALGKRQEAEQAYGEALMSCDLWGRRPPTEVYPAGVVAFKARALASRGLLRTEDGQHKKGEEDLRQALALVGGLKPDEQQIALQMAHLDRAWVRSALGNVLWGTNRRPEATELFRAAEKEWRQARSDPRRDNQFAWFLATCPDTQFRKPQDAVELAKKAVGAIPEGHPWKIVGGIDICAWDCQRTLGVALYRAEKWNEAADALEKAELYRSKWLASRQGGVPPLPAAVKFFHALTLAQKGDKEMASQEYESALRLMKERPHDEELIRFREEAAQLLGIEEKKD